jgi:hypothetical protein
MMTLRLLCAPDGSAQKHVSKKNKIQERRWIMAQLSWRVVTFLRAREV